MDLYLVTSACWNFSTGYRSEKPPLEKEAAFTYVVSVAPTVVTNGSAVVGRRTVGSELQCHRDDHTSMKCIIMFPIQVGSKLQRYRDKGKPYINEIRRHVLDIRKRRDARARRKHVPTKQHTLCSYDDTVSWANYATTTLNYE